MHTECTAQHLAWSPPASGFRYPETMQDVEIRDEMIRLGQFLKLAGAVESGAMAKEVIAVGLVYVNGDVCTARGKQLHEGDIVALDGEITVSGQVEEYRVTH